MGVIRPAALGYILGQFLLALGGTLLVPLAVSLWSHNDPTPLIYAGVIIAGTGSALFFGLPRPSRDLNRREGLLLVFSVWLSVSFFGALPFYFSPPYFSSFTDAFFEATSGFTASGATILRDIESLPRDLQFWRCFSHWLGGMGVVLLGIAILPLLGMGGMMLYRAEFS
jgi:trk system potassium uptake protein TrkH